MGRWRMFTATERADGQLTGNFADHDRRFRFSILNRNLLEAEAAVVECKRNIDAENSSAERQGQHRIVTEAREEYADLRARAAERSTG